jgi:hypothetical protein
LWPVAAASAPSVPSPASPANDTSTTAFLAFEAATERRQVIVARRSLQVLQHLPDNTVWNLGRQPIVKGDVLNLGFVCHSASLSQRGGGPDPCLPSDCSEWGSQAFHLPLDCCRPAALMLMKSRTSPNFLITAAWGASALRSSSRA